MLDKRPWLMDTLLEIGQDVAILTHTREKAQYLEAELNNLEDPEEAGKIVDRLSALKEIQKLVYESYDTKMSFITIAPETKDGRCLLKHAAGKITFAMEVDDSLDNTMSEENLRLAFKVFAGCVSFVLGLEFKSCLRCIYDGLTVQSDALANKEDDTYEVAGEHVENERLEYEQIGDAVIERKKKPRKS